MTRFDAPQPITAQLDVAIGDVAITAAAVATCSVEVSPRDPDNAHDRRLAERTKVTFDAGRLEVQARPAPSLSTRKAGAVRISIELPHGSDITGSISVGDLTVTGSVQHCQLKISVGDLSIDDAASVHLKAAKGDVRVGTARERAEITVASGDARLERVQGPASVKSSNGDVSVGHSSIQLRAQSANGDVVIERAAGDVSAKTANGDVRIDAVLAGAHVELETKLGDVRIGMPEGVAAWIDARSKVGEVRNELSTSAEPAGDQHRVEVIARTVMGDVLLHRATSTIAV
jgi:hypothetical protein